MAAIRVFFLLALIGTVNALGEQGVPGGGVSDEKSPPEPWGRLEVNEIPLSCPAPVLRILDIPSAQTTWTFEHSSIEELQVFLSVQGLSEEEISLVIQNSDIIHDPASGIRMFPHDEFISSMPLSLRLRLYRVLALNPRNRFYHRPLFLNSGNVSEWFRNSGLPRSAEADIARVAYPTAKKRGYFLSDVSYLLRLAENSQDEQTLLRALMRKPTLVVNLILDSESDLGALASYWTADFKNRDVLPLMESVVNTDEVSRIDVAHLLPPTPRRNLFSFPSSSEGASGRYPDWFWTCFNFFRFTPTDVYADSENLESIIAR